MSVWEPRTGLPNTFHLFFKTFWGLEWSLTGSNNPRFPWELEAKAKPVPAPVFWSAWLPSPYLVHVSNQLLPTPTVELAQGTLAKSK